MFTSHNGRTGMRRSRVTHRPARLMVRALEERFTPAAGALDAHFNATGRVTLDIPGASASVGQAVAVDLNDRVIVAGYATVNGNDEFAVARFQSNGALDSSFNTVGYNTFPILNGMDRAEAISLDQQGRVYLAGWSDYGGNDSNFAVARLTSAGKLDTSFGTAGIVAVNVSGGNGFDRAHAIAIDCLGRVVVAGQSTAASSSFAVVRLTTSGALDSTFDGDGIKTVDFAGGGLNDDFARGVVIDNLGRIVVAGTVGGTTDYDLGIVRLLDSGVLDSSFHGDGRQTASTKLSTDEFAEAVTIDGVNRIIVAGSASVNGQSSGLVMRFQIDGTPDGSFATENALLEGDGTLLTNAVETATSVVVDPAERLVVSGYEIQTGNVNMFVRRYASTGKADPTFGTGGYSSVDFGALDQSFGVAIDQVGRVIVGGRTGNSLAVGRLTADATAITLVSRADSPILNDTVGGSIVNGRTMSLDGRFTVFTSSAPNVVPGQIDTNFTNDVFLFDNTTGAIQLISHVPGSSVTTGNHESYDSVISADGSVVAFMSRATNLVAGQQDANSAGDVFLYDRVAGITTIISRNSGSAVMTANQASYSPVVSSDGTIIAFSSEATNLVAGTTDTNTTRDVFVFDRIAGKTTLVSRAAGTSTTAANNYSSDPIISQNGGVIAFTSYATNLVSGQSDTNNDRDVFVFDRATTALTLVSRVSGSTIVTGNGQSYDPVISNDGAVIAFTSLAWNLVTSQVDSLGYSDVFVFDQSAGTTTLVSHGAGVPNLAASNASSNPVISGNGAVIAFQSRAANLVTGQTDATSSNDVFAFNRSTGVNLLVSHVTGKATTAATGSSYMRSISQDGSIIAFQSQANNLIAGQVDTAGTSDVFSFELGTGVTKLVSHSGASSVTAANGYSDFGAMSGDGSVIAFTSVATNVAAGILDPKSQTDVFVSTNGTTILATHRDPASPSLTPMGNSTTNDRQSLSDDGRYMVFVSDAPNLIPGQIDTNNRNDVFLLDRVTGTTRLVSRAAGTTATAATVRSESPAISGDGKVIVYRSQATDLVSGQTYGGSSWNIFLFDVVTETTKLVSRTAGTSTKTGNGTSFIPAINYDGSVVVFCSNAGNLIVGQKGFVSSNIFAYERVTDAMTLVSHSSSSAVTGSIVNILVPPAISGDGSTIAYVSYADNLVAGQVDTITNYDVFAFDRKSGVNTLVSRTSSSAVTAANGESTTPVVNGDGSIIAFTSTATNLVTGQSDTNGVTDVFAFDRGTGTVQLVSRNSGSATTTGNGESYSPAINDDGSFIAFVSGSKNLVPGQVNLNNAYNVFGFDRLTGTTTLVSHANGSKTVPGSNNSGAPSVSKSGDVVAFLSYATNLVPGQQDSVNTLDVFAFDRIAGTTVLASRVTGSTAMAGNRDSYNASISGNGVAIAFTSISTNLVTNDFNEMADVFLYAKPPTVQSVTINDGSAQRSRVTSLTVTFDSLALFPPTASAAFQLVRQSDGAAVTLNAVADYTGPTTVVTLTFTGGPIEFGSLADGRYSLTVMASQVNGGNFDGNIHDGAGDNYMLVGSPINGLFRLFGDSDGSGSVTAADFNAFRFAYGTSGPSIFDFDGDNQVSASDFNAFRTRYGVMI